MINRDSFAKDQTLREAGVTHGAFVSVAFAQKREKVNCARNRPSKHRADLDKRLGMSKPRGGIEKRIA